MQVLSLWALRECWERHPQAERPLRTWYAMVVEASWAGPTDVKRQFGTAVDLVGDDRAIFDIGGNKFRVIARVSYRFGRVMVKFVGTHAEYDRVDAATVGKR
jgi:mRNA interferase HigB